MYQSPPPSDAEVRALLERLIRDVDSVIDHMTDPDNPQTQQIALQVAAMLELRHAKRPQAIDPVALQQVQEAAPVVLIPHNAPAPVAHVEHAQPVQEEYRPSMAENGLVSQVIAYIVPWEHQAMVYNILGNVRVKTSHMAMILVVGVLGGIVTGYIPIPATIKTAWAEYRRDKCPAPSVNATPQLHTSPPPTDMQQYPQTQQPYPYQQPQYPAPQQYQR